jgi:hypothetical protein
MHHSLQDSAETHFPLRPAKITYPWITQTTLDLIEQKQAARLAHDNEREIIISSQVVKQAQSDKQNWIKSNIRDNDWIWVKRIKHGFNSRSSRLKNKQGKVVPISQRAEVFKEFLTTGPWAPPPPMEEEVKQRPPIFPEKAIIPESEFTLTEPSVFASF